MAGLDKILNQIIADAEQSAANRLEAARQEANQMIEEAKHICEQMAAEADKKEAEAKIFQESRIQSSVEQQRRTILLRTKQELIQELIQETYESIRNQTTEDYFILVSYDNSFESINVFALFNHIINFII